MIRLIYENSMGLVPLKSSKEITSAGAFSKVIEEIKLLLKENGLEQINVEQGDEPPEASNGGSYREDIPLKNI